MEQAFEFKTLDNNEEIMRDFQGYENGLVQSIPGSWILGGGYAKDNHADNILNFKLRPDDIWIVTYPKSGTTWMQYLVSLLLNNLDVEKCKDLDGVSPFLDIDQITPKRKFLGELRAKLRDPGLNPELLKEVEAQIHSFEGTRVDDANALPFTSRRLIKSHLPFELLPKDLLKTCKVIYMARDPRDVMVSFFHHHRLIRHHEFLGDFERFFQYFIRDEVMWCPYWNHIQQAWKLKDHSNLLFVFYEDMKEDIASVVKSLTSFLETPLSEKDLHKLINCVSIEEMRKNVSVDDTEKLIQLGIYKKDEGSFIRKGKSGDWTNYFDEKMKKELEDWTNENTRNKDLPINKLLRN